MKTVKLSKILKDLQADGWYEVRQRGSHRQFKHPVKKGTVTVDGKESKTICGFLLKSLERQSGLKF
uniref:type II toxin-antitoxin system HicA family toxin n=1 Tax=Prevotella sp. TaxID=59823 RepID=UPI004029F016